MKTLSALQFKHLVHEVHKNSLGRKFCFILGSGASRTSGILTGSELATKWYTEIQEQLTEKEFLKWTRTNKIDQRNLALNYGVIYRKRFLHDPESGYDYLAKEMENAIPSFGYSVLASILSFTRHNIVITTNFDNLVEESLFYYSGKHPLVCGHENLSLYAKSNLNRPLILKLHRDLFTEPKSDPKYLKRLNIGWQRALDDILKLYIPIVIGYGGNDESLMNYLENLKSSPNNLFWCFRKEGIISKRVKNLVVKHKGNLVLTKGFDYTMFDMLFAIDEIKLIDKQIEDDARKRTIQYKEQVIKIQQNNAISDEPETRSSAKILASKLSDKSPYYYYIKAEGETSSVTKKKIYIEGINKHSTTQWLWEAFGRFLITTKKKHTNVESIYTNAIENNSKNAFVYNNYACYLAYVAKDKAKAELYFDKAMSIDPENMDLILNYASYLMVDKRDYFRAEEYYLTAIGLNIDDPIANKDIGIYYALIRRDFSKAEEYFLRFFINKPNDLRAYACLISLYFLMDDKTKAADYLDKAFKLCNEDTFELAFWFHRYLALKEHYKVAEKKIEELISKKVRCPGWNFDLNIEKSIQDGHPNPRNINRINAIITKNII